MVDATETITAERHASRTVARSDARGFSVRWRNAEHGLVDFVAAIWGRRGALLGFAAICAVIGLVYALRTPNRYASRGALMVQGTANVRSAADAAASLLGSGTIMPAQVLDAVEVIRSRVVLRRVAERVGFEEILRPNEPRHARSLENAGLLDAILDGLHALQDRWFAPAPPDYRKYSGEVLLGAATDVLERNLVAEPSAHGSTIALLYQHTTPDGAERILNAILDESIRRFSDVVAPPEGKDWLDAKVAEAEREEAAARTALQAFSNEHGTTDLTQEIQTLTTTYAQLIGNMQLAKMKLEENQRVLENLREEFAKPSARASATHYTSLETGIHTREIELIGLQTQIPLFEKSAGEAQATIEEKRKLQREATVLNANLADATAQLRRLREIAKTYEISNELDVRGLSSLRVVEPADVPRIKDGPKRGNIVVAAALGGLALAVTWLLVRVRLDRRLLHAQDITFALGRSDVVATPLLTDGNMLRFEEARRRGWE